MQNCKKIEAVVFDIDGTLYPNYKMYITSILFFVRHPVISLAFKRMRHHVRNTACTGDFRKFQISIFAKELKKTEQEAEYLLDKYIYGQFISMFKWIKPFKIIEKMLIDFKSRGIKLGVITDFPVGRKLSFLGLDSYWDIACSADEIGALKPKPDSFKLAAGKLGISPEKIIYVGNHYLYDIIGANSAGMMSAYFSCTKKKNSKADYTFYNYRQFWKFVLDHNKAFNGEAS
ncbi:MAG: HAD family hydrolase [Spirochaetes bacterium]|nr:HAD family hydrolase [Spirochaetota bacterium]